MRNVLRTCDINISMRHATMLGINRINRIHDIREFQADLLNHEFVRISRNKAKR